MNRQLTMGQGNSTSGKEIQRARRGGGREIKRAVLDNNDSNVCICMYVYMCIYIYIHTYIHTYVLIIIVTIIIVIIARRGGGREISEP